MSNITRSTAHNVLRYTGNPLDVMFSPRHVAVIGATPEENQIGHIVVRNLVSSSFGGTVFPINPQYQSVLDLKCYERISDISGAIDLAVIATPARTVPGLIRECVSAEVKACIILSADFKETGPTGILAEQEILSVARKGKMRVVGPNCLGIMNTTKRSKCDLCRSPGPAGERRICQPKRRALFCRSRLESARKCRFQRLCIYRIYAGRGVGGSDLLSG